MHLRRKKGKHGTGGNELKMPVTVTEGLTVADKGYGRYWLSLQGSSITDV